MSMRAAVLACLPLLLWLGGVGPGAATGAAADELRRLDELVLKGSHNSYHKWPRIALHPRHRYQHDSLYAQLEHQGVRAMELDLHLSGSGEYQVYHVAFIDDRSHCKAFVSCLEQIRAWSDTDREHEPLMIWIEVKDYAGGRRIRSLRPVDRAIRKVLGDRLITPDDVRGSRESLRAALVADGWPTLAESRGKVLFMLIGSEEQQADYTSGFRHLRGRVMFANAGVGQLEMGWAGVVKLSDPAGPRFESARRAGMLVTTTVCVAYMSDAQCFRDRDYALAAGANILLDDYVRPVPQRDYFLDVGYRHVAQLGQWDRSESDGDFAAPAGENSTAR